MPSYVEFNKTNTYPASSENGKLTMVLNNSTEIALTDHNGNTTIIGGGGSGFQIPQPIISITGGTNDGISVQFADTGYDFSLNNPELFLFRWRNNHRTKQNERKRNKKSKWVHPSTEGCEVKWQGWKFFNGIQTLGPFTISGRTTEWEISPTIKPYERMGINFNKYMFWNIYDLNILDYLQYDVNVFGFDSFLPTNHQTTDYTINIGGTRGKSNSNIIKYALAVAIDNPNATKQNGQCPKIFGPLSESFYSVLRVDTSNYVDIRLIKENEFNHKHVIKNALN
jgi:hypothetical protein